MFSLSFKEGMYMQIPEITLKDKVVLITGASKGMGVAFAVACAEAGAAVAATARSSMKQTADLVKQATGKKILTIKADMQKLSDIESMIQATIEHYGKLDVLVNNAAIVHIAAITETTVEDYNRVIDTNLKGVYFACKYAAQHMIPRKSGVIINLGSELSHTGAANYTAYSATKGAVYIFSQALAIELGQYNIRVVTLSPGPTNTDMCKPILEDPDRRDLLLNKGVLGRVNEPEDLAPALVFLASDAARNVTGTSWSVDCGCLAK
jgi:NAD(P)-dependent dehydrogenase (short-subunit alcohol dehydrogenase family)